MTVKKSDSLVPVPGTDALAPTTPPAAKARKKDPPKRTVVSRVIDEQSGFGVDVAFDAPLGMFEVVIPGYPESIFGKDFDEVTKRAKRILRETREYQWRPVIVVDAGRDGVFWDKSTRPETLQRNMRQMGLCEVTSMSATLAIRYYRLEIAPKPGDPAKFVCRPHADDVTASVADGRAWVGEARSKSQDIGDFLERERATVLPYTPGLWAAVQQAAADVLAVGERLRALLKSPDTLAATGARLLEAGTALALTNTNDADEGNDT